MSDLERERSTLILAEAMRREAAMKPGKVLEWLDEYKQQRALIRNLTAALDEASRGVHRPEHLEVLREANAYQEALNG